jgi:3-oxoadipate enol-lactonase
VPTARVNGIDLYYEMEGDGPVVIFCHGVGGNHLSWWQQVPEFSRRFRCITFDHRGFALSPNPDGVGAEAFSTDLEQLLDHLGVGEAFLVGQSMGGRTVLNFAKGFPHRAKAIVMAGSVANIRTPELDRMRREVSQGIPDRSEAALGRRMWQERPQMGYLYKLVRQRNPARPKQFLWQDNKNGTSPKELAALNTPTLLLVGDEDRICPPHLVEHVHPHFDNARLMRVPEAGHSVYFERPEIFNSTVIGFFEQYL